MKKNVLNVNIKIFVGDIQGIIMKSFDIQKLKQLIKKKWKIQKYI
jgi:phosphatidate phosphatase PAH1